MLGTFAHSSDPHSILHCRRMPCGTHLLGMVDPPHDLHSLHFRLSQMPLENSIQNEEKSRHQDTPARLDHRNSTHNWLVSSDVHGTAISRQYRSSTDVSPRSGVSTELAQVVHSEQGSFLAIVPHQEVSVYCSQHPGVRWPVERIGCLSYHCWFERGGKIRMEFDLVDPHVTSLDLFEVVGELRGFRLSLATKHERLVAESVPDDE